MALQLLRLAFLTSFAYRVDGHGYLTRPTARRLKEKKSSYTGITAFGAGQHITNCGKDGLSTPSSQDVVTDVQRGSIMKFDIVIDAHHAGHFEMRLCPFIIDGDDQDLSSCTLLQRASATEVGVSNCTANDDRDICASIDPNNPEWWYLAPKGPQGNVHSMWFHIPSDVNCPNDRCTIQFTWKTANSCNPHPVAYCNYYGKVVGPQNTWCKNWYCGGFCNSQSNSADNCEATMGNRLCCSEVFTNCAEVQLRGAPSPSTTTFTPTSSSPTTATSTTTTTTNGPTTQPSTCKVVPVNGKTQGATISKCDVACAKIQAGVWPCKSEGPCACNAPSQSPTPMPTSSPTAAPTSGSAQCGSCKGCLWTQYNACYTEWSQSTCNRYIDEGYQWCA
jgi:hypothetical protein